MSSFKPFAGPDYFFYVATALGLAAVVTPVLAAPALITSVSGEVSVEESGAVSPVSSVPAVLNDGARLHVPAGGSAVVLGGGAAVQVQGPRTVDTTTAFGSAAANDTDHPLAAVLSRQSSQAKVAATRGAGGFHMVRPVPTSKISTLTDIRWTCEDCGNKDINVIDQMSFESVWSGAGADTVAFDGPALAPGEYAIQINNEYHAFTVVPSDSYQQTADAVTKAAALAGALEPSQQIAVQAAIWWHAGMFGEALNVLDTSLTQNSADTILRNLRADYAQRVGVP
jgi:hypothetical protein